MKKEVRARIAHGIVERRELLQSLSVDQKRELLELLFKEFFGDQHRLLQKWGGLTGQTAQIDTGYIAQFVASIVTGIPGQGFRGKGFDLVDGSEVKSAANISGVDRPRWNHNLGKISDDEKRREQGKRTICEEYLSSPYLFYLLVDRPAKTINNSPLPIRIRAWCVDAQRDESWRNLFGVFQSNKSKSQYNLQLHPPVGHDDNQVVNTLGNLDFSEVLVFDYRLTTDPDGNTDGSWFKMLNDPVLPVQGRTVGKEYHRSPTRGSNYTDADDLVMDLSVVADMFPTIIYDDIK